MHHSLPGPLVLLKESWELYKKKYKTLISISLIGAVGYLLFMGIFLLTIFAGITAVNTLTFWIPVALIIALIAFGLGILFQGFFGWIQLALIYAIKHERSSWRDALGKAKRSVWAFLWLMFLMSAIIPGGYALFIIPGIIFSFWFSQSIFILLDQNKKGMEIMLISKAYVQGRFAAVVGRLLVVGIILMAVQTPFIILTNLLRSLHAPFFYSFSVQIILTFISVAVLTPMTVIYSYLLYSNLKKQRGAVSVTITKQIKTRYMAVGVLGIIISLLVTGSLIAFISGTIHEEQLLKRDFARVDAMLELQNALEVYHEEKGEYPKFLSELTPNYIDIIPTDPSTHMIFPYEIAVDGQMYSICPHFERIDADCFSSIL